MSGEAHESHESNGEPGTDGDAIDHRDDDLLEAIENLLKEGYRPDRTILLGLGHDEEVGGKLGAESIAALLAELARRGKTVVVVTHDPAVAATCSRVVQLADGRLAERAS